MNQEIIAKAREAKSAEELLAMAKENDIELTGEQAKEYYDRLHATGELADDELDNVAGGGCGSKGPVQCPNCGVVETNIATFSNGSHTTWTHNCLNCGHSWTSRM